MNTVDTTEMMIGFGEERPPTEIEVIDLFAKANGAHAWNPEDCIAFAEKHGVFFEEPRNWGLHFRRAAKLGIIERGGLFSRKTSNGSVRPGWVKARGRRTTNVLTFSD